MAERNGIAYRASMLPVGNNDDGSIAFPVWPQAAVDAYEALGRFQRGEPPQPQDAILATFAMTGAGMAGLGGSTARIAANAPEAAPAGLLATSGLERLRAEEAARPRGPSIYDLPPSNQFIPETISSVAAQGEGKLPQAPRAGEYRDQLIQMLEQSPDNATLHAGGVPVPGNGDRQDMPDFQTSLAELQAALADLNGGGDPSPGNAMSQYAQGASVPKSLVPRNVSPIAPGFETLPAPQMGNAMAASASGQQGGQQYVNFPIGANGETERRPAGVPPPPEQGLVRRGLNAMANYTNGIVKDVTDDPMGAVTSIGAWNPIGAIASGNGPSIGYLADPVIRTMGRNAIREFTPAGQAKNAADESHSLAVWQREQSEALQNHPDVTTSRQPHWELQGKDPATGRWQKLPDDVRASRERGVELRRREQEGTERAKKYNGGSN